MKETPDIETSSDVYARRFANPAGTWFLDVQAEVIQRMIAPWPRATVLEVGGGHGQLAEGLARRGYDVTVFGSDPVCGERIKPLIAQGACRFASGDLLQLPYRDRAFDIAVSIRLLMHLEGWAHLVAELARVARHAVVVDYPPARSFNALVPVLFNAKRQLEGDTRTYRVFRDEELVQAFAAHGFRLTQRSPQFFWPVVLHRVLGRPGVSRVLEAPCRAAGLTQWLGSPVIARFTREDAR